MSEIITPGARIQALRKAAAMSQSELAEKLGVSRSLIAQIEGGNSNPSLDILSMMVEIFNTSYEYIIKGRKSNATYPILDSLASELKEDELPYGSQTDKSNTELLQKVVAELIIQSQHLREVNEFLMKYIENAEELVKKEGPGADEK